MHKKNFILILFLLLELTACFNPLSIENDIENHTSDTQFSNTENNDNDKNNNEKNDDLKATLLQNETQPSCYTTHYSHKQLITHPDRESCKHHKNLIKLSHSKINRSSLCIRVNGQPVEFESVPQTSDEFIINAVAGPRSTITAQYCLPKIKGPENNCNPHKDTFSDAIGIRETKEKKELNQKVVFKDWIPQTP